MAKTDLTAEQLREHLHYNPDTGIFTWLEPRANRVKKGQVAGNIKVDGYWSICLFDHRHTAHRLAFLYMTGSFPKQMVDHINGNKSDNRFSNLREANNSQNKRNTPMRRDNTSGYKGVILSKHGRWIAQCNSSGGGGYLGSFGTPEEARRCYQEHTKVLHGEFYHD